MNINDLPAIDIWPSIFKNLSIRDLLNCKLVNKKFKNFSTNNVYRLIISEFNYYDNKYWNYNNELIEENDIINYKFYKKINSFKLFNLDKSLKLLIINGIQDKGFKLIELCFLDNLEYLELENLELYCNQCLEFKNLKYLVFERIEFKREIKFKKIKTEHLQFGRKINLNIPKLNIIKADNLKLIEFVSNPESIKHLKIIGYENELSMFKNLEIIELDWLEDDDLFDIFIKLKKIKFSNNTNEVFDVLKKLFNKRNKLNRQIDIYFRDVKIDDVNLLNEHDLYDNDLVFQINNHNQLDSILSTISANYNDLENSLYNLQTNLTTSFFNKLANLQVIHLNRKVHHIKILNWFLRNLKNLKHLHLNDSSLNERLCNILIKNLPNTIKYLHIKSNENIKNYDFIFKLTKLNGFIIGNLSSDNIDPFNLADKLFSNLKCLEYFQLKSSDNFKMSNVKELLDQLYQVFGSTPGQQPQVTNQAFASQLSSSQQPQVTNPYFAGIRFQSQSRYNSNPYQPPKRKDTQEQLRLAKQNYKTKL